MADDTRSRDAAPASGPGPLAFAAVLVLCILGGGALLSLPPQPLPAFASPRFGATELLAGGFRAELSLPVRSPGRHELRLRVRSLGAAPAEARVGFGVDGEAASQRHGRVVAAPGAGFTSQPVAWDGGDSPLVVPAGRSCTVVVEGAGEGFLLDGLDLLPLDGDGAIRRFEAEDFRLGPGAVVGFDASAAGGLWAGVLGRFPAAKPERVTQTFLSEADGLSGLVVNLTGDPSSGEPVRMWLQDAGTGAVVWETRCAARLLARHPGAYSLRFPAIRGSRGRSYEFGLEQPASHPVAVALSVAGTHAAGGLSWNGVGLANSLIFVPRYRSPWSVLPFVAAFLVVVLLAGGFRSRRWGLLVAGPVVVLVGAIAIAYWQRDYQFVSPEHWLPDGYDVFATRLRDLLASPGPGSWQRLDAFLRTNPHAHSPLVPFVVAAGTFFPLSLVQSYLLTALVASVLAGFLLLRLLEEVPGLSWRATWACWGVGVTHFLFLRGAVRPSTDPVGYLFVVAGLYLGARLLRAAALAPRLTAAATAVIALGLFSRPTVLPLGPALAAALLKVRGLASPSRGSAVRHALALGALPPLLFGALVWAAGYSRSFVLAAEKMQLYSDGRTGVRFLVCLAVLVQLLLVPIVLGLRRGSSSPTWVLGAAWVGAFLGFLLVSATFWNRHFLHALPGLLLVAAPGVGELERRWPRLLGLWFLSAVALGLSWALLFLSRGYAVRMPYLVD